MSPAFVPQLVHRLLYELKRDHTSRHAHDHVPEHEHERTFLHAHVLYFHHDVSRRVRFITLLVTFQ